jgi:Uma2 family endonuclease
MSVVTHNGVSGLTAADLADRFGAMPLSRIVFDPPPGAATEADVVHLNDHCDRLCELADGVLVEKTVGAYESFLAMTLARLLGNFAADHDLGIVLGPDGLIRLAPGLVRIPDLSFIDWRQLPQRRFPRNPIADLVPDLAVEVISPSNTRQEMDRKLAEYFAAGVRLVWYVHPEPPRVVVYHSMTDLLEIGRDGTLTGGDVLPGFALPLAGLFTA